jgi:hypothetical protein
MKKVLQFVTHAILVSQIPPLELIKVLLISININEAEKEFNFIVIKSLEGGIASDGQRFEEFKKKFTRRKDHYFPNIFIILNQFPSSETKTFIENIQQANLPENNTSAEDSKWQNTIITMYADTLRWEGLNISKRISWERTAQDYLKEYYTDDKMKVIRDNCRHAIIRFGLTGVIHTYRLGKDGGKRFHRLFFDPSVEKLGILRDTRFDGEMVGYQSILLGCVTKEIAEVSKKSPGEFELIEAISVGIRDGIHRMQQHFMSGAKLDFDYQRDTEESNKIKLKNFLVSDSWDKGGFRSDLFETQYEPRIADQRIPVGNPAWNILVQSAEYNMLSVANNIVSIGVDKSLNKEIKINNEKSIIMSPVVRFGEYPNQLVVIDRREIESYRAAYALIEKFIAGTPKKPISIAIFGPPGAGKSFLTKKLVGSIPKSVLRKNNKEIVLVKFNLTKDGNQNDLMSFLSKETLREKIAIELKEKIIQLVKDCKNKSTSTSNEECNINIENLFEKLASHTLQSISELSFTDNFIEDLKNLDIKKLFMNETDRDNLKKSFSKLVEKTVPFIFFDEFDADLDGKKLGWLKYFLSPMEDFKESELPCKLPIFCFAGGTSHTHLDFAREDLSIDDNEISEFKMAKGPDFVSRLGGHINILGPNPVDEYDEGYIARRALLLRSYFVDIFKLKDDCDLKEIISLPIIRTLLLVSSYKHGAIAIPNELMDQSDLEPLSSVKPILNLI